MQYTDPPTRLSHNGGQLVPEPDMIELVHGGYLSLLSPRPDDISIRDIAGATAKVCRFAGHVKVFYSVAEHSVLVCELVKVLGGDRDLQRHALMHDAAEAFIGDITAPMKWTLRVLELMGPDAVYAECDQGVFGQVIERAGDFESAVDALGSTLDIAIAARFGLNILRFKDPLVVKADLWALRLEARELMRSKGEYWRWPGEIPDHWPEGLAGGEAMGLAPEWAEREFLSTARHLALQELA